MTQNEAVYLQQVLLTRATTKWLTNYDLFGDFSVTRQTGGWMVENYLDEPDKALWQQVQQFIRSSQVKNHQQAQKRA